MTKFELSEVIFNEIHLNDVLLTLENVNPENGDAWQLMCQEVREMIDSRTKQAFQTLEECKAELLAEAFPEERKPLVNHPDFSEEKCESLAKDIYNLLLKHEMWIDTAIYYNGKCMATCSPVSKDGRREFRYNGEPFITENEDPRDYFEYVSDPHILSMSFEGPLYDILNYYDESSIPDELEKLLGSYGLYYELGNAWNLSCWTI